jgi:hypothetical protein
MSRDERSKPVLCISFDFWYYLYCTESYKKNHVCDVINLILYSNFVFTVCVKYWEDSWKTIINDLNKTILICDCPDTHTHAHAHTRTYTYAHAHTHAHARTRTHTRTHAHARTRTHTHNKHIHAHIFFKTPPNILNTNYYTECDWITSFILYL